MGIKSFRHKGLEEFFLTGSKRGIRPEHAERLADVLDMLHRAVVVGDMDYSGSFLHPLKGQLDEYWSVRISGNWRLIFRFKDGDAFAVTYLDYH
jgi:proteic killer suppression protein